MVAKNLTNSGSSSVLEYKQDCLFFNGYKPCKFGRPCLGCGSYQPRGESIGVISLEALGAVLRSTCLLPPLRRSFPNAHITWITYPNAIPLLENHPGIDRLVPFSEKTAGALRHLVFDRLLCVDKSFEAGGLAETLNGRVKLGFGLDSNGSIRPMNPEATYLYDLGLSDKLKFFENEKAETQLTTEALGLDWQRDPYTLYFTAKESEDSAQIRREGIVGAKGIIGFNTGCSILYPYKKFTVERSIEVIHGWRRNFPEWRIFLLGGREDSARQQLMKSSFANDPFVVNTPTDLGMRQGATWIDACDMVFSGDSLGMHIAIARQKSVVAWFGLSCAQEIDLYDRGVKLHSQVKCSPCWKKSCANEPKCFDQVSVDQVVQATREILLKRLVPLT